MASNGEDLATLDEALAFIEFCDDGSQVDSFQTDVMVPSFRDSFMLEDIDDLLDAAVKGPIEIVKTPAARKLEPTESPSPQKKKRMRSDASSSTVLQRRKKAELQTLREQATELQNIVNRLRKTGDQLGKRHHSAITYSGEGQVLDDEELSEWHRHAVTHYQQRQKSEQSNRRLKEVLKQQWKVSNKLRSILHKRNVLEGMGFVRTFESPSIHDSFLAVSDSVLLMDQLEVDVESAYRNFAQTFRPRQDSIVCCSTQTIYDEKRMSNVVEFVTATPLEWSMRAAFTNVWGYLESSSDRSRKPNTLETKVNLTLPIHDSAACHFHKLHFLRKYEELDRVIIIWSDLLQMTTKNLCLRTQAHAVFVRSETDPQNASVMHTNLKLYLESLGGDQTVSADDVRYAQEVVLGAFGKLMRQFWQDEQNWLLEVSS